jgi:uncharacterized protein (UPF0548 family)
VFSLARPSSQDLTTFVREQASCELTYAEVGATSATMPAGYRHDRWHEDLGRFDSDRFARAVGALKRWEIQRGAGLTIFPGEPVEPGMTFALVIRLTVGFASAAGRVVYVVDQPGNFGFAYGTLPGHPEQGEEAFHVVRDGDQLSFMVTAFSRPRHPAARLGAPVARAMQLRVTRAYLAAMRSAANDGRA